MIDIGTTPPRLLTVEKMPLVKGLIVPDDFYLVIRQPALLAGMICPTSTTSWSALYETGLKKVICLTEEQPLYIPEPLSIAGHFPLQDLYNGISPYNPEAEKQLVCKASELVINLIMRNIGVLVHCAGGTGRTGTVIGCALKELGYNSSQVLSYLDQLNRLRGARRGWPESDWQAEMILHYPEIRMIQSGQ
jgi:hypothetical protein